MLRSAKGSHLASGLEDPNLVSGSGHGEPNPTAISSPQTEAHLNHLKPLISGVSPRALEMLPAKRNRDGPTAAEFGAPTREPLHHHIALEVTRV